MIVHLYCAFSGSFWTDFQGRFRFIPVHICTDIEKISLSSEMVFAGSSGDKDGGECFKECELLVLSYLLTL